MLVIFALAADFSKPHPHRETRPPFKPDTVIVPKLGASELETLAAGQIVLKQAKHDTPGGVGVAIEDVAAPPKVVWDQLLSFETYPSKVPRVKICENYEVKNHELKTRFVVKVCPGYTMEYYCHHVYSPAYRSLTWTLDYDKTSDIDDVHGIWRVIPHPSKRGWSRVEYSADIRVNPRVPSFIVDILTKKALREACAWVKTESELQNQKDRPRFASAWSFVDSGLRDVEASVVDAVAALQRRGQRMLATTTLAAPTSIQTSARRRRFLLF